MSTGDDPTPESITFMIDGRHRVLDAQAISEALGIPLERSKGLGIEEWDLSVLQHETRKKFFKNNAYN